MNSPLFIRKYHFLRSLVAQPFFIFNSLQNSQVEVAEEEADLNEESFEMLWNDELTPIAFFPNMLKQRAALTFQKIDDHLIKMLKSKKTVILSGSLEARLIATNELIKAQSPVVIIKPAFEHQGAYAEPFAYDMFERKIINLKYSKKTSRLDFLSGYYDYVIINQNVPVENYGLVVFADNDRAKKHEINLTMTEHGHTTKTPNKPSNGQAKSEMKFIDAFEQGLILDKGRRKVPLKINLPDFKKTLKIIKDSPEAKISPNLLHDKTNWGANPEWNLLLEKIKSPFANWSGNICSKDLVVENPMQLRFENELGSTINGLTAPLVQLDKLDLIDDLDAAQAIQWYDFESFMLPIPATDFSKPYDQIVFQVSTVLTQKNEVKAKHNHLFDPKTIDLKTFKAIIDAVYEPRAQYYVVYNQGFELARLQETVNKLGISGSEETEKYQEKVDEIKSKTVDLYDFFRITKGDKIPPILLPEQKGKASIKNVEKYINKHHIKLPVNVKAYKDLDVKNGFEAMGIATDRALGITSDEAWSQKTDALKTYCENDVEAMRMVFYYIKKLSAKDKHKI